MTAIAAVTFRGPPPPHILAASRWRQSETAQDIARDDQPDLCRAAPRSRPAGPGFPPRIVRRPAAAALFRLSDRRLLHRRDPGDDLALVRAADGAELRAFGSGAVVRIRADPARLPHAPGQRAAPGNLPD